ncbi:IS701 family transposase [Streptomyces sp. NPDC057638]|uniref:IS701 family transposase n=1 Tax=Streptomyces sp. NPDC057638 TaxID=3346190 RepID=UPI0036CF5671
MFAERIFECLPRADQRRWAGAYVEGLLTTPGKKTVRNLAAAVSAAPAASQSLHQFVNASPWDWNPVRAELARWTEEHSAPRAWVISQAVLRKRGEHSCGVHRRFMPATGRSVTCQVGVGLFLAAPHAAVPVDWRLLLPGSWTRDDERRLRTRIPDGTGPRSAEQHALDLVDTRVRCGRAAPLPVVADLDSTSGAGATALVRGLTQRGRDFVIAVPPAFPVMVGRHLRVQRPYGTTGPGGADGPGGQSLVLAARGLFAFDEGTLTRMESVPAPDGDGRHHAVMSSFVRLPHGPGGERDQRTYRLFALRAPGGRPPTRIWLTSLTHHRMEPLLGLTRLLGRSEDAVRTMAEDIGLLDFEGRSYPGWHHHMTLVSAAYAYRRLGAWPAGASHPLPAAA